MESIKEKDLNLQREVVTTTPNTWLVKAVNPSTGEEKHINISNFASVVAGVIGTVTGSNSGLMPSLTKSLHVRNASGAGILLLRLQGSYSGAAILFTSLSSRGQPMGLYALTASYNGTPTVYVSTIVKRDSTSNLNIKYTLEDDVLSIYMVRDANVLTIGLEVIYADGIVNFAELANEIPAGAVNATYQ